MDCQNAFVSQVLNGDTHFSLEHGIKISAFLDLNHEEEEYFLLLLQYGRAGSVTLEKFFERQIDARLAKRNEIQTRIKKSENLSLEVRATYYSSWIYIALHIHASIPEYQTREALRKRLALDRSTFDEAMRFLIENGILAEDAKGRIRIGPVRIHLERDSPLIGRHHSNWRMKAVQALDRPHAKHLHYSGVFSLSESDVEKIRQILLESIEKSEPILRDSPEETVWVIGMDFFEL